MHVGVLLHGFGRSVYIYIYIDVYRCLEVLVSQGYTLSFACLCAGPLEYAEA